VLNLFFVLFPTGNAAVWADRLKQIAKIWRSLPPEKKAPFLQKARENRAAVRLQKSHQTQQVNGPHLPFLSLSLSFSFFLSLFLSLSLLHSSILPFFHSSFLPSFLSSSFLFALSLILRLVEYAHFHFIAHVVAAGAARWPPPPSPAPRT